MIEQLETRTIPTALRRAVRAVGRAAALLALGLLLTATPGCSTDDTIGGLARGCLVFEPASEAGQVTTEANVDSTCDLVQLDIVVSNVDKVWSASFEVHFPSGIMVFSQVDAGDSFLLDGATNLLFNAVEVLPGVIEVGISRDALDNVAGADSGAEGLLISLFFLRAANSGQGAVTLQDANLTKVETAGDPPEAFDPAITFSGGRFTITPL